MKPLHDYSCYEHLRGKSGVYKFENIRTGKCYIGRSKNVFMRMCEHFRHSANDNDANLNSAFYKALRSSEFEDLDIFKECSEEVGIDMYGEIHAKKHRVIGDLRI